MSGDQPYTAAGLRQREKDQQDPAWLAWLAAMPDALDEFLTVDVPDMPADPWSAEGLLHAEHASLVHFPSMESVGAPSSRARADRTIRYLGEVFRRNFEGKWCNVPELYGAYGGFTPAVEEPYVELYLEVVAMLTATLDRRTGREWAGVFGYAQEDHADWVAAGRPDLAAWVTLRPKR